MNSAMDLVCPDFEKTATSEDAIVFISSVFALRLYTMLELRLS